MFESELDITIGLYDDYALEGVEDNKETRSKPGEV